MSPIPEPEPDLPQSSLSPSLAWLVIEAAEDCNRMLVQAFNGVPYSIERDRLYREARSFVVTNLYKFPCFEALCGERLRRQERDSRIAMKFDISAPSGPSCEDALPASLAHMTGWAWPQEYVYERVQTFLSDLLGAVIAAGIQKPLPAEPAITEPEPSPNGDISLGARSGEQKLVTSKSPTAAMKRREQMREAACKMSANGAPRKEIAKKLGVSVRSVYSYLKELEHR